MRTAIESRLRNLNRREKKLISEAPTYNGRVCFRIFPTKYMLKSYKDNVILLKLPYPYAEENDYFIDVSGKNIELNRLESGGVVGKMVFGVKFMEDFTEIMNNKNNVSDYVWDKFVTRYYSISSQIQTLNGICIYSKPAKGRKKIGVFENYNDYDCTFGFYDSNDTYRRVRNKWAYDDMNNGNCPFIVRKYKSATFKSEWGGSDITVEILGDIEIRQGESADGYPAWRYDFHFGKILAM